MKKIACALLLFAAALVAGCTHYHYVNAQGWATLIDGTSGMENFDVSGSPAKWQATDGAIGADGPAPKGGASVLVTKKSYKDFELHVEFYAGHDTNSGIYIRAPNPKQVNTASGAYEVQIWDKNPNPAYSTGSLVNVAQVQPIYKAGGRWNKFEIFAQGPNITVRLNGVVTAHTVNSKSPDGRIGIQFNGGPIKVRKMQIKEL
jgi:hypothetical protein